MMYRSILAAVIVCLIWPASLPGQQTSPSPAISPPGDASKTFDPAEATKAWLATVPAEKRERSDAYFAGGYWLILWNFLLTAAILLFLLESRISARVRDFA